MGYDNQRKGWKCYDPTIGKCHISRNVIFDEASSWQSSQIIVLPDTKKIEEKLQEKFKQEKVIEESTQEKEPEKDLTSNKSLQKVKSPWRIGVHQQIPGEARPSQLDEKIQQVEEPVEYGPHL